MKISNIQMGIQIVLAIVLILSIMPQDTKSAVPSQYGGEGNQTADLPFTMHGIYNMNGCNGTVTTLCDDSAVEDVEINQPQARKILYNGALYLIMPNGDIYNAAGVLVNK